MLTWPLHTNIWVKMYENRRLAGMLKFVVSSSLSRE